MSTLQNTHPSDQASRSDILRIVSLILVLIGIVITLYLSYTALVNVTPVCTEGEGFDCGAVQNSVYSKIMGIPIAYLGLLAYLALGGLLLLENRIEFLRAYGPTLVFGLTLFGFIYSMWLVYVQAAILQSYCTWCLGHEAVMTLLFILSAVRLYRSLRAA